jgi:hypothetical protein
LAVFFFFVFEWFEFFRKRWAYERDGYCNRGDECPFAHVWNKKLQNRSACEKAAEERRAKGKGGKKGGGSGETVKSGTLVDDESDKEADKNDEVSKIKKLLAESTFDHDPIALAESTKIKGALGQQLLDLTDLIVLVRLLVGFIIHQRSRFHCLTTTTALLATFSLCTPLLRCLLASGPVLELLVPHMCKRAFITTIAVPVPFVGPAIAT